MEWVNEPPCTSLNVEREDYARGLLVLHGPQGAARAKSGLVAAMGAAFALGALTFFRMPFPKAWKLIPMAMAATGGGMAAIGLTTAISDVKVEVERGKGIRWAWRPARLKERELRVAAKDIAGYEIKTHITRSSSEVSFRENSEVSYHLMVIAKDGKAYSVEEFWFSKQAEMRRDQIERVLGTKSANAKKKAPARRKRAAGA